MNELKQPGHNETVGRNRKSDPAEAEAHRGEDAFGGVVASVARLAAVGAHVDDDR